MDTFPDVSLAGKTKPAFCSAAVNFRDHGICPFFSIEIVYATVHALTLNFVKAMDNNEYLSIFQEMELAMHTKL